MHIWPWIYIPYSLQMSKMHTIKRRFSISSRKSPLATRPAFFPILEPQNQSTDVSGLNKVCRWTYFEAQNPSGRGYTWKWLTECPNILCEGRQAGGPSSILLWIFFFSLSFFLSVCRFKIFLRRIGKGKERKNWRMGLWLIVGKCLSLLMSFTYHERRAFSNKSGIKYQVFFSPLFRRSQRRQFKYCALREGSRPSSGNNVVEGRGEGVIIGILLIHLPKFQMTYVCHR